MRYKKWLCVLLCVFVSLLRFYVLANEYICYSLIFSRLELLSAGRINTVHVDTQGSEISANFNIGHFCFVLYGKCYISVFEGK